MNQSHKTYHTAITQLSHDGRGIGVTQNKVALIDFALPDEHVEFQITKKHSRFIEGYATNIDNKNPMRIKPQCDYFQQCGGCRLQHIDQQTQLEIKQKMLLEQLQHFGKTAPQTILPPIAATPWHYRHKARLGIRYVANKKSVLVGFREYLGRFLTDMDHCEILHPKASALIKPFRDCLLTLEAKSHISQAEIAVDDKRLAIVLRHLLPLSPQDESILVTFAKNHDLDLFLQPKGLDSVHRIWPQDGDELLHYTLAPWNIRLAFAVTDFTQINPAINLAMLSKAIEYLDLSTQDTVLDLFSGIGNFTLPIAQLAHSVCAVEVIPEMIERGKYNARWNNLANIEFFVANLQQSPLAGPWYNRKYNKILIDPPRTGALDVVKNIQPLQAQKIVYVSCNPATLARDSQILVHQHGYQLSYAGIIDMFPQTLHTEALAVFER